MCKKGDGLFKEYVQKVEGFSGSGGISNNGKGDDNRDGRYIIGILLWKDGGLRIFKVLQIWFSSVKGLMWVRKEVNLIILFGRMRKLG